MDYRALNKISVKNRYPLPRIEDIIDQLQPAKLFSKLDLKSGYHQVRVTEEDTWKTAFKTKQGLYELGVFKYRSGPKNRTEPVNSVWSGLDRTQFGPVCGPDL